MGTWASSALAGGNAEFDSSTTTCYERRVNPIAIPGPFQVRCHRRSLPASAHTLNWLAENYDRAPEMMPTLDHRREVIAGAIEGTAPRGIKLEEAIKTGR